MRTRTRRSSSKRSARSSRAYEAIVAQYPASGYSDNALWQAGHLALDAFWRFGQAQDKDTCVRLLQRLVAAYPTSKLAKQVPAELRQAAVAGPRAATATVPAPEPAPATASSTDARIAPPRPASGSIATIRDIRRSVLPDAVRVTIELDGEVPFHDERIPDPSRVFLDLPGTRPAAALLDRTLRFESDADIVRQVRLGRHPNNTTRVVLDADGVTSYSVYPLYNPYRLVIDCVRGKACVERSAAASLAARRVAIWLRSAPAVTPQHGVIIAAARSSVVDVVAPPPPPATAERADTGDDDGVNRIRQPRRLRRRIRRPGMWRADCRWRVSWGWAFRGSSSIPATAVTIPARRAKASRRPSSCSTSRFASRSCFRKSPGVEVILTRRTDEFIPLPERTAIANREGADLFLSIHANASSSTQARGIETYFLNFANNQSAAAVAARENATSAQAMGALPDFVKAIALQQQARRVARFRDAGAARDG